MSDSSPIILDTISKENLDAVNKLNIDAVSKCILACFLQRSEVGYKKYGVDLDRTDLKLSDWYQHAKEEGMDLVLYLEKIKKSYNIIEKVNEENAQAITGMNTDSVVKSVINKFIQRSEKTYDKSLSLDALSNYELINDYQNKCIDLILHLELIKSIVKKSENYK